MPSTREIYGVFADNLRILIAERGSVSDVCRSLGVNRTQFNRYLNGQASPRPEVLHRICAYFDTDARILLDPLPWPEAGGQTAAPPALRSVLSFVEAKLGLLELRSPPPMGIHRYWQRSSINKTWANSYTIRLFNEAGATLFRSHENVARDGQTSLGVRRNWEVRGWMLDQDDGIVMQAVLSHGRRVSFGFLNYPMQADGGVYPGVVLISRPEARRVSRVEHCALELLPQGPGLRPALRESGGRLIKDLPEGLRPFMSGKIN